MTTTHPQFMALAFSALCILAINSDGARAQKQPPKQLHVSVSPVLPLVPHDPEVVITYCNGGKKQLSLLLPKGKMEISMFRDLTMRVDGKRAKYAFDLSPIANPIRSRYVDIKPGKSAELRIKLKTIFKLPKRWEQIELSTTGICGIEAQIVGNLTIRRITHTFLDPIHITASPVLPMDFNDPKITVRFQNIGKKIFDLPLPKPGRETEMFRSLRATIDRKKVLTFRNHSPFGGYKKLTRFVPLKPAESTEITIRLKDYFDIPKDWKLIEIPAKGFSLVKKGFERFMNPKFQDTLTLVRPLRRPVEVPIKVWEQSNDRVRWFLVKQAKRMEKLKAKSPKAGRK